MNKKTLGLLAAVCLGAATGCGAKGTYVGLGYTASFTATQATVNVAVAAFDNAGKIVNARLDVVQIPLAVSEVTKDDVTTKVAGIDTTKNPDLLSKVELGLDYGMLGTSSKNGIGKEVYEQIEAFAKWTVGKTVDEVVAGTPGAGHGVAVNEELATSVTITVDDFEAALKDAFENKVAAKASAANAGVGIFVEMYGANELTTYIAGAVTDKKGVVEAAQLDNVVFPLTTKEETKDGVTSTVAALADSKYVVNGEIISKKKLGTGYGMAGKVDGDGDGVKLEWNEQAAAIENYVVGKDAAAISAMTYTDGKNADLVAVDATIKTESIMKAVAEAVSYSTKDVITAKPNA